MDGWVVGRSDEWNVDWELQPDNQDSMLFVVAQTTQNEQKVDMLVFEKVASGGYGRSGIGCAVRIFPLAHTPSLIPDRHLSQCLSSSVLQEEKM